MLCLDDNYEIKYPDFECKAIYPPETRTRIVSDYLQFYSFDNFTVGGDGQTNVIINPINTKIDSQQLEDFKNQTKQLIDSLGVSHQIFNYKIIGLEDLTYDQFNN